MGRMLGVVLSGCLIVVAASVLVAAPPQGRAGEIDPARVWIQNRSSAEAIPVTIETGSMGMPLPVQLVGAASVTVSEMATLRQGRQAWEYQVVTAPTAQALVTVLNAAGRDGWDTTGIQLPGANGAAVILKRPR